MRRPSSSDRTPESQPCWRLLNLCKALLSLPSLTLKMEDFGTKAGSVARAATTVNKAFQTSVHVRANEDEVPKEI